MPTLDGIVRVNQSTYAWGSSVFRFDGLEVEGMLSLDYEEKLEVEAVHAARRNGKPVAYAGNGKYVAPTVKGKMLKDSFELVKAFLAAGGSLRPGLGSYGDALFTFQCQCVEPIIGSLPITLNAAPCKMMGVKNTRAEGTGALAVEFDMLCLDMIENGIPLWSIARSIL